MVLIMDNRVNYFKDILQKKPETYISFLKEYSPDKKNVYGFVEGKDDPVFYKTFIDNMLPTQWQVILYPTGNKNNVLKIHDAINWNEYSKHQINFFIDRDHSKIVPERINIDDNIYITDSYSIENSIVNEYICERTLREICGFSNISATEFQPVLELFKDQLDLFYTLLIPLTATIIRWRQLKKIKYPKISMNLNNLSLSNIYSFQKGKLKQINYFDENLLINYFHSSCNVTYFDDFNIENLKQYLQKDKRYELIRGKYLLWFLVGFCISIHESWNYFFPHYLHAQKCMFLFPKLMQFYC